MLGRCIDGEYPTLATVASTVSSGVDPNPANILDGGAVVVSQESVHQQVDGGLPGVVYRLQFAAETNLGSLYIDTVFLAILPDPL
jgi:hypothetical protein